jgi:Fe-Mn family superoxide dismutase
MTYALSPLPFALDALEPHISRQTLSFHYHKHHQGYVEKLNALLAARPSAKMPLEELIRSSSGNVFDMAAQVWNHEFFWNCLTPKAGLAPTGPLARLIDAQWGDRTKFQAAFSARALEHFGSGWTWLVLKDEELEIVSTANAHNPVVLGCKALLTLDTWEHAYYLDYKNDRAAFIRAFWQVANWEFASQRMDS